MRELRGQRTAAGDAPATRGEPRRVTRRRRARGGRLEDPSALLVRLFTSYARRYLARHFHALRVAVREWPEVPREVPVIVCLNHPSWWDPLVAFILARELFPERRHRAPIDADALSRYRFLERLGLFPVRRTLSGARTFLEDSLDWLSRPGTCLWLTPQGRFADPRERPVELEGGIGHLLSRLAAVRVVAVALEYPFWEERLPEALALVDGPLATEVEDVARRGPDSWTEVVRARLESVSSDLAHLSIARDRGAFDVIVEGRRGVTLAYDTWRRCRALLRGERFSPGHGSREGEETS